MHDPRTFFISNVMIYAEVGIIQNGYIKITEGKIAEVGEMAAMPLTEENMAYQLYPNYKVIPGMIDIHIHGVAGSDTMDATPQALETMASTLPSEGTTSFLATTITQDKENIEKALINAASFIKNFNSKEKGVAEVLGIHLEGPFISPKKAGAQPLEHILPPDLELFRKWQELAQGMIKLVTLAPEQENGLELIRHLKQTGVIASIGHSNTDYEGVVSAIEAGASHVTHLFNAMTGIHHREPGVAGAALLCDELTAEMIVDGIHMRPEIVQLAYRMKTKDKLVLITDSMRAKCLKAGVYELGGQKVMVSDTTATLSDGTLAGSILKMKDALQNVMKYTGCKLEDIIQMAAVNPAKELQLFHRKGSIAKGKDADLVILDENNQIEMTYCFGKLAYKRQREERGPANNPQIAF